MKRTTLTIGTRGSELAQWQTAWIAQQLHRLFPEIPLGTVVIRTTGDKILDSPLSKIGDKGVFTKEIERALLDGTIDFAVHSLKDLPTAVPPGLAIAAVTEREDVRDVFIAHPIRKYPSLKEVPQGGSIATGSLRRKCQLLHHRPDLQIADLRGSLRTRKEKLENSHWDGIVLAKAGVTRLGWTGMISEIFEPDFMLPAVGQGALAVEIREDDEELRTLLKPMNHLPTFVATSGERALLRRLEGGCQIPIGTYGRIENGSFKLNAMVGSLDGSKIVRGSIEGPASQAETLGPQLAEELLRNGAEKILGEIRKTTKGTANVGSSDIHV
ncbi:MAG: hydroxymethylbilane synthase [Ignavibacteriales bacterium]|nr:hydroxymethylbilane synthase [Ignavibacteriales bacterium]